MRRIALVALMIMFVWAGDCRSQELVHGTPKARVEFEKAEFARKTGDTGTAINEYRRAIELDPDYVEAHQRYILIASEFSATGARGDVSQEKSGREQHAEFEKEFDENTVRLDAEYHKRAKEHPDKAVYQWALGEINMHRDPKAAIRYFETSVSINPKFAPAYRDLSVMDKAQGDVAGIRENLRKACEADPNDPQYLVDYANTFRTSDMKEFDRLSLEVVRRFPGTRSAAQSIYELADAASSLPEKLLYLEILREDRVPAAHDWKSIGMAMLFDFFLRSDPGKALAVAQEMVKTDKDDADMWKSLGAYAHALSDAGRLEKAGKAARAVEILNGVKLSKWDRTQQLVLRYAAALEANKQTEKAYDTILSAYATTPTDDAISRLLQYGQELGKNKQQVEADVWSLRTQNSRPEVPFSLPRYTSEKDFSLDDFRGHVTLLNFWYPLCGPCHHEFPYIQAVLDKYKNYGFTILAVNIEPAENDFVLPLLRGFKLGFIPLKGTSDWALEKYNVRGEPTSFLIGSDGRIYFGPIYSIGSSEAQRTLELQVEALLARQAAVESKPGLSGKLAMPLPSQGTVHAEAARE